MSKPRILIIGWARSGKDTLAEVWRDVFGMTFESSSMAAAKIFIYDELKDKYGYKSFEECYKDRMNHRAEWHDLIVDYNTPDKTRLARGILEESDCYVGMRSPEEIEACLKHKVFDIVIWVDAEGRVDKEPESSCGVRKEHAHVIIENKEEKYKFVDKALKLGNLIFNKWN